LVTGERSRLRLVAACRQERIEQRVPARELAISKNQNEEFREPACFDGVGGGEVVLERRPWSSASWQVSIARRDSYTRCS